MVSIIDFGATGDNPSFDDAPGVNAAIEAARDRKIPRVYCPPGRIYNLYSPIRLYDYIELVGEDWYAHGGYNARFDAQTMGMTMIDAVNCHSTAFRGIQLNGSYVANIGIRLADCVSIMVERCGFSNFSDTASDGSGIVPAAIRGGGNQICYFMSNIFNASYGYAMDLRNKYSEHPERSYYGCNVGMFSGNVVCSNWGIRWTGIGTIDNNIFEHRIDGEGAVVILLDERDGNCYFTISNNHFDLQSKEGVPVRAIVVDSSVIAINGNSMYGDGTIPAGSIGIFAKMTYGFTLLKNYIGRFETGVVLPEGYAAHVLAHGNTINECTTTIQYPKRHYMGAPNYQINPDFASFLVHVPDQGHVFGGTFSCVPAECVNTGNMLNLTKGRFFEFTNSQPTVIDTLTGVVPGLDFFVCSKDGNTALQAGPFGLQFDLALIPFRWYHFVVGTDLQVREVSHS